jgi:uncharacterized protein YgbK (DUF1537 family)
VFGGYLFVGDVLLSESGMRDHPLNPMRDPNLVRVLQRQTPSAVARIDLSIVRAGRTVLAGALREAMHGDARHVIVDAVSDEDLRTVGGAAIDAGPLLICGGSGVALGLPDVLRPAGSAAQSNGAATLPPVPRAAAILAGSCSVATRAQIAHVRDTLPLLDLSGASFDDPERRAEEALAWADSVLADRPIVIVASADPEQVAKNQQRYGAADAGARVERTLAAIARGLRDRGVGRFVIAGGETSGAVVEGLSLEALRIGPQIDPGVPWTASLDGVPVALALKSGNFGAADFFTRALTVIG